MGVTVGGRVNCLIKIVAGFKLIKEAHEIVLLWRVRTQRINLLRSSSIKRCSQIVVSTFFALRKLLVGMTLK